MRDLQNVTAETTKLLLLMCLFHPPPHFHGISCQFFIEKFIISIGVTLPPFPIDWVPSIRIRGGGKLKPSFNVKLSNWPNGR